MRIDVIVPVRRLGTVDRLLYSLSRNIVQPDLVSLVSNEIDAGDVNSHGLNLRLLRFRSDTYPIGFNDAALRRNVGVWASPASHVLMFDDDQIAPPGLVQAARAVLEQSPVCWGHHRFIDFDSFTVDQILALPPEKGRTREHPPNAWHSWRSAYAGLVAADRALVQRAGGFDMVFSGRHGGEDQDLGRRLATMIAGGNTVFVHEPPFAWHPERSSSSDTPAHTNLCGGDHDMATATIEGLIAQRCRRCPFYWVPESSLTWSTVQMAFDPSRVTVTTESVGAMTPLRLDAILPAVNAVRLEAAADRLRVPYAEYVERVSSPDMALSLRAAALLRVVCEELRPRSVLDLGSGFTSFVFRQYAQQSDTDVWSVDDDAGWLERSRQFVESHHTGTEKMLLWEAFVSGPRPVAFDLVCHDLGGMAARSQLLPHVLPLAGEDGVVVLDDMHKDEYAPWVDLALRGGRWRYVDVKDATLDHYGRFCGIVLPAAHTLLRRGYRVAT